MKGEPVRILLVEDNTAHAKLVMINIKEYGIVNEVTHVTDGQAALDYLYAKGEYEGVPSPHLVLLDLRLPKVDGLEVLSTIKNDEVLRKIPVVVLTTSTSEMDIGKAYDNHANAYLAKPIDFEKFSNMLKSMGFFWLCWNVSPE